MAQVVLALDRHNRRLAERKGLFRGRHTLPQWSGDDGLLMQKILVPPNWDGINLYSERAQKILEFVKSDWQK